MHSRQSLGRRSWLGAFALAGATLALSAHSASAQGDSARAGAVRATVPPRDSLVPPLSPRRAFLYSFIAPGYSQSVFGRNKAAAAFILTEAIALSMIRESTTEVAEARRSVNDTVVTSWIDGTGQALVRPDTAAMRFGDREVRSRRAHLEDWIAILVANHLFAGADAYVASNLWDVPARVGLRLVPRGAMLVASFRW